MKIQIYYAKVYRTVVLESGYRRKEYSLEGAGSIVLNRAGEQLTNPDEWESLLVRVNFF